MSVVSLPETNESRFESFGQLTTENGQRYLASMAKLPLPK